MRCGTSEQLMSRVLDDRASDAERRDLEAHLAGCARCREHSAVLGMSSTALRAVGRVEPPEGLAERAARAAFTAAPARAGLLDLFAFLRWPALATATASAALALALLVAAPRAVGPDPSGGTSLAFLDSGYDVGLDADSAMASVLAPEED